MSIEKHRLGNSLMKTHSWGAINGFKVACPFLLCSPCVSSMEIEILKDRSNDLWVVDDVEQMDHERLVGKC